MTYAKVCMCIRFCLMANCSRRTEYMCILKLFVWRYQILVKTFQKVFRKQLLLLFKRVQRAQRLRKMKKSMKKKFNPQN